MYVVPLLALIQLLLLHYLIIFNIITTLQSNSAMVKQTRCLGDNSLLEMLSIIITSRQVSILTLRSVPQILSQSVILVLG
jgi:hypothetical protein